MPTRADRVDAPRAPPGAARFRRQNPVNGDARLDGRRIETAGIGDGVPQGLTWKQLVDRRPEDLARHRREGAVHRHEHDIAGLQPDAGRVLPLLQVVVEVDAIDQGRASADEHPPEAAVRRRAAGGVQGREHGAGARNLVGAGPHHVARQVHLDVPQLSQRELEPSAAGPVALDARVHPSQPGRELRLDLVQRLVGDIELTHLGDHHEAFAGHLDRVGALDVAGEDEHHHVARAEAIVLVHGPHLGRLKPCRGPAEGLEAEDLETTPQHRQRVGERVGAEGVGVGELDRVEHRLQRIRGDLHRVGQPERVGLLVAQHAQRSNSLEGAGSVLRRHCGIRARDVAVEQVLGVPGGPEPGAHLLGREP